jgi:hypothetical protein
MKKLFTVITVVPLIALVLTGCSSSEPLDICDCMTITLEMTEEFAAVNFDPELTAEITESYQAMLDECKPIETAYEELLRTMSQEELAIEQQRLLADCPSFEALLNLGNADQAPVDIEVMGQEMCNCIDLQIEYLQATADYDFDAPETAEIEAEFMPKMMDCDELFERIPEAQFQEIQQKIMTNCPQFSELEKLMNEQMDKLERQMQEEGIEGI